MKIALLQKKIKIITFLYHFGINNYNSVLSLINYKLNIYKFCHTVYFTYVFQACQLAAELAQVFKPNKCTYQARKFK